MSSLKDALGLKPYLAPMVDSRIWSIIDPALRFDNTNRAMTSIFVHWITTVALPIASDEGTVASLSKLLRCSGNYRFQNETQGEKIRC